MKILLLHTFYTMRGGEDTVFEQEYKLLLKLHEVEKITFQNKSGLPGAIQFLFSFWNPLEAQKLKQIIIQFKPDVIHMHNVHFAIGPIALHVARKMGVPVVVTLHNYRMLCPSGILQHNGVIFTDSLRSRFPWKAIWLKVYRDSALQTFWLALVTWGHKKLGTWKNVTRYIVLTEFAMELFQKSSLNFHRDQIIVKPNFVQSSARTLVNRHDHFLFVGRFTEEKGISVMLEAFIKSGYKLHLAGTGPLIEKVISTCNIHKNITYLGSLGRECVQRAMQNCSALVFPSTWYEGMPMTILEAFSVGTPVLASEIGAMSAMITHRYNGLHFEAGNTNVLIKQLDYWQNLSPAEKETYCTNALGTYLQNYTPEKSLKQLSEIYQSIAKR
jgi:glycosyltransferase involved in cell wall biosynthesis